MGGRGWERLDTDTSGIIMQVHHLGRGLHGRRIGLALLGGLGVGSLAYDGLALRPSLLMVRVRVRVGVGFAVGVRVGSDITRVVTRVVTRVATSVTRVVTRVVTSVTRVVTRVVTNVLGLGLGLEPASP